jgi:hypothetical protein
MNANDRNTIDIFTKSLTLLHVDDNGLTDETELDDIKAIAQICPQIRDITAAGETPEDLALHRLATLTERVCLTWGVANRQAVKEWSIARAELLVLRITTM